jgi:hypothetical protein
MRNILSRTALQVAVASWLCHTVTAQQVVAPTPGPNARVRGEDVDGYNIVNSFELGYRWRTVGGNLGKYRSDVNFGNGVRLLGSTLTIHSKEGHGRYFDELVMTTLGLGNDPYQSASLRLQKNRIFRYDLLWRLNEYYNPALPVAFGQHLIDTRRRLQDHDLTLLPQSRIRLFLGYSRNSQTGPALSTVQQFAARGDEFPYFQDVRRIRNEYRLGGDVQVLGAKFTWMRGWDNFKEDTRSQLLRPSAGAIPDDLLTLASFRRDEPYHGNSPYWRLGLFREKKAWSMNARFNYVDGRRDFVLDEAAAGTDRFGSAQNRQLFITGDAHRPMSSGNLTLAAFPADRFTLTNHTAFSHVRIDGDSIYRELSNQTLTSDLFLFRFLGIRVITNQTDADLRPTTWLGFRAGYQFSTRRIRSIERSEFTGFNETAEHEQSNRMHTGLFALRLRPAKPVTVNLDAEMSRADRSFFPIGDRNYHALGGRLQYKRGTLLLSAAARSRYNTNSVALSAHSSRSRNYAFDASWAPRNWLAFDTGYSKLHLDTLSGIAYFLNAQLITDDRSLYLSNIHAGNFGARLAFNRVEFYLGYSRVQDVGDGRGNPVGARPVAQPDIFRIWQVFPVSFESPLARVSIRLSNKIRWNAGYQFYRYGERFFSNQDYRAHTGYASVLWSF